MHGIEDPSSLKVKTSHEETQRDHQNRIVLPKLQRNVVISGVLGVVIISTYFVVDFVVDGGRYVGAVYVVLSAFVYRDGVVNGDLVVASIFFVHRRSEESAIQRD